jgi:hypothetical protein
MLTKRSSARLAGKPAPRVAALLESISAAQLRQWVEHLAVPRNFLLEPDENEAIGLWLAARLQAWGYDVQLQGPWRNVVALPRRLSKPLVLIGAHYDSVGGCPGADDNASAVAALLGCAKACAEAAETPAAGFVAFNREEDNLEGSRNFVSWLPSQPKLKIALAHVLEMVGFASTRPGSQTVPPGLPVKVPDTGDFLGILANRGAGAALDTVLARASTYLPRLPVIGLNVMLGVEKMFPVLLRSDHAPFWAAGIPATMWTDTSEFRNPYYHEPGDKPDTLDYDFLRAVTQLLIACVLDET